MEYEIYDIPTANLVRSFPTEEEALAMVRRAVQRSGQDAINFWLLTRSDFTEPSYSGKDLVLRAMQVHA